MKTLNTKFKLIAVAALVVAAALCAITHVERRAHAQDQQPPPVSDRISFGMVGITQGQTIRLSVVNTTPPPIGDIPPPNPDRVVLTFRNANGQLIRNRSGEVIRRSVELQPGDSTFLDLNYDDFPPGPTRFQLRAVVTVIPPPIGDSNEDPPPVADRIATTVEVINNANGRTAFALASLPTIQKLIPPPIGE